MRLFSKLGRKLFQIYCGLQSADKFSNKQQDFQLNFLFLLSSIVPRFPLSLPQRHGVRPADQILLVEHSVVGTEETETLELWSKENYFTRFNDFLFFPIPRSNDFLSSPQFQDFRFLCPNDTVFDQQNLVCANWFDVDCEQSVSLFLNEFGHARNRQEQRDQARTTQL